MLTIKIQEVVHWFNLSYEIRCDVCERMCCAGKKKRYTDRGLSLISGRLVQEIRPLGEASCLACLRLPVIIIKAAAEQSSHLERHPMRTKIKEERTVGQKQDCIKSNEQRKHNPNAVVKTLESRPLVRCRNTAECHGCCTSA